jgi:hypothetical protein
MEDRNPWAEWLGLLAALFALALLVAGLVGCPGTGVRAACTRYEDGRVECGLEVHRDGHHERPVTAPAPKEDK